jgi:pentatricopeptide repeat protein
LVYYQAEKYEECVDAATDAIKIKPNFAEAYNNIGSAYNVLKKWDDAIIAFEKALQINPNFELAKNNLLVAQKGKNDLNSIQKIALEKPSSDNYINLSLLYYNQGLYEKSIEACKKAIDLKPDNANAYNNIAAAYCKLKQWDKAIDACNKALQIDPTHQLAAGNLNWAKQEKAKIK